MAFSYQGAPCFKTHTVDMGAAATKGGFVTRTTLGTRRQSPLSAHRRHLALTDVMGHTDITTRRAHPVHELVDRGPCHTTTAADAALLFWCVFAANSMGPWALRGGRFLQARFSTGAARRQT